jgi:hypothetical protein
MSKDKNDFFQFGWEYRANYSNQLLVRGVCFIYKSKPCTDAVPN